MNDAASAVGGLATGLLKILATLGGVVLVVVGLVMGSWTFVWVGVGVFVLGQVIHAVDQSQLDKQLAAWATEAVGPGGPVPPRPVRKQLARLAWSTEGVDGDVKYAFQSACRSWAAEQRP